MVMCWVPECRHYSERRTCKFFCFPANPMLKQRWIDLIGRSTLPTRHTLICSCHFVNGDRNNLPTIFKEKTESAKRKFEFPTPEQRKRAAERSTPRRSAIHSLSEALENASLKKHQGEPLAQPLESSSPATVSGLQVAEELVAQPLELSSQSRLLFGDDEPLAQPLESICEEPEAGPSTSTPTSGRVSSLLPEAENYFLKQEIDELKKKLAAMKLRFSYKQIENKESQILMYTGIPSGKLFKALFNLLNKFKLNYYATWEVTEIPKEDQLFMTLMKLRLNPPHEDLGVRFGCTAATVTNIFMTYLYAMHEILFNQLMSKIPSRQKNAACLPVAFTTFSSCRIVLDCTEMYSVVPKNLEKQRLTYSHYKHRNTWKILVGVAPNGVITYVSKAYPGSTSDQKIVAHSGILNQMEPGDLILADKGFLIKDLLPDGVSLNIPPFLTTAQFTEQQVYETQKIARARIHVERAIRRIKCFHILDKIPQFLLPHISVLAQTCAALTNFQYPLIKEVEQYYT